MSVLPEILRRPSLIESYEEYSISRVKVVVVGGGIAGLSAVEHLQANGLTDFLLLEASNRFGGRMHSTPFGGSDRIVELGANWIHGGNPANCVYTMACRHRLLPEKLVYHERRIGSYHFSDGRVLEDSTGVYLYDLFKRIEVETESLSMGDRRTWEEFLNSRLKKELKSQNVEKEPIVRAVFNHFRNYVAIHGGDSLSMMTARGYGLFVEIPGGNLKLPAGFSTLSRNLVARLPASQVLINHKVATINWEGDAVQVKCANGHVFVADYVIVTLPLGVLKATHDVMFEPILPLCKVGVIERIGFGRVDKIFLEYEHPFWQTGKLGILSLAWSDQEYASPGWTKSLLSFDEVYNNPKVLCTWIAGPNAELVEDISEEDIGDECTRVLRRFLGDPSIPAPRKVLVSRWCSNPNFRGSYSYLTDHCQETDFETLALPVPEDNPRLLFAGEATSKYYFSTMHGARASGLREAQRVLKLCGSPPSPSF